MRVLDVYPGENHFHLLLGDEGKVIRKPWEGALHIQVGDTTRCIGKIVDDNHIPCPDNREVSGFSACSNCEEMDSPECVFEPRCVNDLSSCVCPWAQVEHIVYLAMYGRLPKVGMTKSARIEKRMREQGADGFVVLGRFHHRSLARVIEKRISAVFSSGVNRIPEYRTHYELLPLWAKQLEGDLEAEAEKWLTRIGSLAPGAESFVPLNCETAPTPLPGIPTMTQPVGIHKGKIIGARGNYLLYQTSTHAGMLDVGLPRLHAIKRHSLIGREIQFLS